MKSSKDIFTVIYLATNPSTPATPPFADAISIHPSLDTANAEAENFFRAGILNARGLKHATDLEEKKGKVGECFSASAEVETREGGSMWYHVWVLEQKDVLCCEIPVPKSVPAKIFVNLLVETPQTSTDTDIPDTPPSRASIIGAHGSLSSASGELHEHWERERRLTYVFKKQDYDDKRYAWIGEKGYKRDDGERLQSARLSIVETKILE